MIRQAISCDICGAEKRQTNHWFVAYEQNGELRVNGWTSRHRLRPESKHLCGQTCLHKLMDEFIAKSIAKRTQHSGEAAAVQTRPTHAAEPRPTQAADTSLTTAAPAIEFESSARLLTPPEQDALMAARRQLPDVVTMLPRQNVKDTPALPADTARYASRRWHAEAWERERERELRANDNHPDIAARHRTSA